MSSGVNKTMASLGLLEQGLRQLAGIQNDYRGVSEGQIHNAVYAALGNAYETGGKLAETLNKIAEAMNNAGLKTDNAELEAAGLVSAAGEGLDGAVSAGSVNDSQWSNNQAEAVGNRDMTKVNLAF
ncbi:hypothetical protein [Nocardia sp. CA-290969]|uniref:hypothetical protein n=1 Tax=Nocardia sp. CA-290969 TaxID=3239986 RepID=UPI003D8D530E